MNKKSFLRKLLCVGAASVLFTMPFGGMAANAEEASLGSGLAGYWKFDDASGTVAEDSSGWGRHMYLNGNENWTTGIKDGAFYFDGSSIFEMMKQMTITVPNVTSVKREDGGFVPYPIHSAYNPDGTEKTDGDTSISISYLMKIESFLQSDNGMNCVVVMGNKTGPANLNTGALQMTLLCCPYTTNIAPDVAVYDPNGEHFWLWSSISGAGGGLAGNDRVVAPDNIDNELGKWHMITYVIDDNEVKGTDSYSLFIDGKKIITNTISFALGTSKNLGFDDNPMCVGGNNENGEINRAFNGTLDELKIWTRALADNEVLTMAQEYGFAESDSGNKKTEDKKSGCGSSIAAGCAVVYATVIGLGVLIKKRK